MAEWIVFVGDIFSPERRYPLHFCLEGGLFSWPVPGWGCICHFLWL